jgi:NADPH2:quinone reductase
MRAFTLTSLEESPGLRDDIAAPVPGERDVLVRVHASSVNPVDAAIAAGMLAGMVEHRFPVVLGRDYAGVVEVVGSGVTRYGRGDEVFAYLPHANPDVHDGSWAELIVVPEDASIARSPKNLSLAEAGAAPLAGITAMVAIDALELAPGQTLLAARAGATVIAPALDEDRDYLRELGVSEVLDRNADTAAAVAERYPDGIDALLDVVSYSPDGFEANAASLKPGGRGASPVSAAGDAPGRTNVMASATAENLQRLAGLLEDGTLKVHIQNSYALENAGDALRDLGTTHTRGKLALSIG